MSDDLKARMRGEFAWSVHIMRDTKADPWHRLQSYWRLFRLMAEARALEISE